MKLESTANLQVSKKHESEHAQQINVSAEEAQKDAQSEIQAAQVLENQCLSFISSSKPVRVTSLDVFKKK